MDRTFPSITDQSNSRILRNDICRLATPERMAEVSSHLRNFAVAEVIGVLGLLDGHPRLKGRPGVQRGPAAFQQVSGQRPNPLTHVAPSNLLLKGENLSAYMKAPRATALIERIFGMGVMAPDNWDALGSFDNEPVQLNITDNITEGFAKGNGLVAAFERTAAAAVAAGRWDGSGQRRHNLLTLPPFIEHLFHEVWKPGALAAYQAARGHLEVKLREAQAAKNKEREAKLRGRLKLVGIQTDLLRADTARLDEAARNVLAALAGERWR
jgi:hypothetical protein